MKNFYRKGQALVTLLIFMIITITITSAAVAVMILNSQSANKMQEGLLAYNIAEGGAENAILRLLRDPDYTGETLIMGEGVATITVSGVSPITINSEGRIRNFLRKIRVTTNYNNGIFTISSWKEIW